MKFKDKNGSFILPGNTVLTMELTTATVVEHDPKVYGDDKVMVEFANGEKVFYYSEDLLVLNIQNGMISVDQLAGNRHFDLID